jgi:hypothetical protein
MGVPIMRDGATVEHADAGAARRVPSARRLQFRGRRFFWDRMIGSYRKPDA